MRLSNWKQIKINYKAQLPINLLLNDEIERKIKMRRKKFELTQANSSNP